MPVWTKVRVADDADHPPGLLGRQHVAQAEADADGGAHADAGVHGLEGRQHAQRVAADVAGDDAVELAQRVEDRVVRAGRRRARGGLPCGGGGSGESVAGEDAADPVDVELAEAEHLRLRLDGDAGGAAARRRGPGRPPR